MIGLVPEVAFAVQEGMTRPFSRKRTVPGTEVVAVMTWVVPFFGEEAKERVMVERPVVMVTVIAWVAVAPLASVAVMVRLTVPLGVVPLVVTMPLEELIERPVVDPEREKVMLPVPPEAVMAEEDAVVPKVVVRFDPPERAIAPLTVKVAAVEVSTAETE